KQQRLVDRVSNEVLAHESNLKQNLLRTHSRLRQESMPDTHLDPKHPSDPLPVQAPGPIQVVNLPLGLRRKAWYESFESVYKAAPGHRVARQVHLEKGL
ncbi:MAG: hypothetical protein WCE63_22220, partial [Acidobacteriaceae bacterium]